MFYQIFTNLKLESAGIQEREISDYQTWHDAERLLRWIGRARKTTRDQRLCQLLEDLAVEMKTILDQDRSAWAALTDQQLMAMLPADLRPVCGRRGSGWAAIVEEELSWK